MTTTTTTVVKTTTTSTTLVSNDPSKTAANAISSAANAIVDAANTVMGKSSISDPSGTSIPPVVSSNSLIKQEDNEDGATSESKKHQVHSISPETTCHNRIHSPSGEVSDTTTGQAYSHMRKAVHLHIKQQNPNQDVQQGEPETVDFEGMCFYLMSPTRELGINVKLKLLEEFNPTSSLLRLASKYVTAEYTTKPQMDHPATATSIPETIPITIDTVQKDRPSLLEPFTDIVSTAAATSTASTIAALQTAVANASAAYDSIPATAPSLMSSAKPDTALETRCMDALDFHSINVANRIWHGPQLWRRMEFKAREGSGTVALENNVAIKVRCETTLILETTVSWHKSNQHPNCGKSVLGPTVRSILFQNKFWN